MKLGGLCFGYGGLDMAVQSVIPDAELAWYSEIDTGANKIAAHRFPGIPNIGDMTKVDWTTVEPVDILTGGTPCFPAGTLIDTTDGYRPIETIRLGDSVKTHVGRYMPVVDLMRREATDTVSVKVMGAPEFVTTLEHPFYVRTKSRRWNNERRQYDRVWSAPDWMPAGFLTTDSFVGFALDDRDESVPSLGQPLAHLIGRWLGDGWVRNALRTSDIGRGRRGSRVDSRWWNVFICCAHEEADELAKVIRDAGFDPHAPQVNRTATRFRIGSKPLVKLLSEFGSGAAGKRIPGWVYRLPAEEQQALWQGWVNSDGSTQVGGQIRVTTVSEQLAHGMSRVARNAYRRAVSVHRFDMPATCVIEGRTVNQRPQYQVVLPTSNREAFIDGGWCWVPVRSVKEAEPDEVYNFGVAEDESYTAWGLTVHNCQDLSHAGKRAGMTEGTRSNLWVAMREAIATLRPSLVVWENVGGAASAEADSEVEPCPGCVGDGSRVSLRALGRVVGDLSSLGYVGRVRSLRAADVGAPHGRLRYFLAAHPASDPWRLQHGDGTALGDSDVPGLEGRFSGVGCPGERVTGPPSGEPALLPTPRTSDTNGAGPHGDGGVDLRTAVTLLPTPACNDMGEGKTVEAWDEWTAKMQVAHGNGNGHGKSLAIEAQRLLPTPNANEGGQVSRSGDRIGEPLIGGIVRDNLWGQYADAITRWETLTRPAPPPTQPSKKGTPQLSPRFSEWMQGLPDGWVTGVPGITRNEALKAIGNGVVPAQAAAALRFLLGAGTPPTRAASGLLPTPTSRDSKGHNQRGDTTCLTGALLPTPRASDGEKGGPNQRGSSGDLMLPSAVMQLDGGAA